MKEEQESSESMERFEQALKQFGPRQSLAVPSDLLYRCGWEAALASQDAETPQAQPNSLSPVGWFASGAFSGVAVALLLFVFNGLAIRSPPPQAIDHFVAGGRIVQPLDSKSSSDSTFAVPESALASGQTDLFSGLFLWNPFAPASDRASSLMPIGSGWTPLSQAAQQSWGNALRELDLQRISEGHPVHYSSTNASDLSNEPLDRGTMQKRLDDLLIELNAEDYL